MSYPPPGGTPDPQQPASAGSSDPTVAYPTPSVPAQSPDSPTPESAAPANPGDLTVPYPTSGSGLSSGQAVPQTPPASPFLSQEPPTNPYAAETPGNPFASQPAANPYGSPPPGNAFGSQPPGNAFGSQPGNAFGSPPAAGAAGGQPTTPFASAAPGAPSGPRVEPYAPPTGGGGEVYGQAPGSGYEQGYGQVPGYEQAAAGYGQPQAYAPYGQPAYAPQYAPPYAGYGTQSGTNGLAIASLVCSLVGLATCISAPVGIVLGHIAKRQIRETGEQGDGLATAGLWVGYILSALLLLVIAAYAVGIFFAINQNGGS